MIKLITVLIIILLGYLLFKIKLGYVIIIAYLISFAVKPVRESIEQLLMQHEFLWKAYSEYLPYILLVFLLFNIRKKIFSNKKNLTTQPNEVATPIQKEPVEECQAKKINSDGSFSNRSETEVRSAEIKAEKYAYIDNSFINLMSLKESFWDSSGEEKVYNALKGFINIEEYIITPHVGLSEIFSWEWKCFDYYDNFRVSAMHFDFVIHNKNEWSNRPALVIEVWGADHKEPKRVDNFKKSILEKCKVPFVVINMQESISDNKIRELVIDSIKEKVPSREFYNVYCPKCGKVIKILLNQKTNVYYYGCEKYYKKVKSLCNGNRSISDLSDEDNAVKPLYRDIPIKYEK